MPSPLVSVSVDLDAIECYQGIHALEGKLEDPARHAILRRALPRFAQLFAEYGVKATFFTVGCDLGEDAEGRANIAHLSEAGHEIANHSYHHPYQLTRMPREQIAEEIDRSHNAILAATGRAPVGFRAPGYTLSTPVLEHLILRGYRYDSSIFPATPYYLAKAAALVAIRATGRTSQSMLGSPRVLWAPREPYRPRTDSPYARGNAAIVELPVTVTPWLRLPVIGTSLVLAPAWLRRSLVAAALGIPHFNLELHGIDLADATLDEIPSALVKKQPDLRRGLGHKENALRETLTQMVGAGARFQTLEEVAKGF